MYLTHTADTHTLINIDDTLLLYNINDLRTTYMRLQQLLLCVYIYIYIYQFMIEMTLDSM